MISEPLMIGFVAYKVDPDQTLIFIDPRSYEIVVNDGRSIVLRNRTAY